MVAEAVPSWKNYDHKDWRNHPDPEPEAERFDSDEELPWPDELEGILGFDPSTIDW